MAVRSAATLALQKQLLAAGFNPGPLDGIMGPKTRAAMQAQATAQARVAAPPTPAPAPAPAPTPAPPPAPSAPPANPLYSDPAFLAYAANSGRDYETAAADVQRKKAAIEGALTVSQSNIKSQGQEKLKSIYGDYASRGLYGAGQQAEDEGKAQAANLQDIAQAQSQASQQIEDLQSGLAQKRQDILAQASAKGYDVAGSQDLTNRLGEVDKKYPLGGQTGLRY